MSISSILAIGCGGFVGAILRVMMIGVVNISTHCHLAHFL